MKKQCHFFQKGMCKKGTSCEFLHDQQQPQMGVISGKTGISNMLI
jgi:hypothetical protein